MKSEKCGSCCSKLRQMMCDHKCTHKDTNKVLGTCFRCFRNLETVFGPCSHIHSTNLRKLDPSGYSFVLMDNYKKKLVQERSYFQKSPEDPTPVKHFMNLLQEETVPFLTSRIIPNVPMKITEQEEKLFKQATSCYCCNKKFQDIPGNEVNKKF